MILVTAVFVFVHHTFVTTAHPVRDSGQQPSGTFHHQSTRVVVASGT